MLCPECKAELKDDSFRGLAIKRCTQCAGSWLDLPEMNELEDTVYPYADDTKGTMIFNTYKGDFNCPVCQEQMQRFNYRFYDLVINFCPKDGYWLEKGEEDRVLDLIKEEAKDMVEDAKLQDKWANTITHIRSPNFVDRIKGLFQ